jgi:hypothetical protein
VRCHSAEHLLPPVLPQRQVLPQRLLQRRSAHTQQLLHLLQLSSRRSCCRREVVVCELQVRQQVAARAVLRGYLRQLPECCVAEGVARRGVHQLRQVPLQG